MISQRKKNITYLRIFTWEKEPSNKTPALTKSKNKDIWVIGTSNQLFSFLLKQNLKKNKVITGKTPFSVVHFVLIIPLVLTLASDMAVLHGNDEFTI